MHLVERLTRIDPDTVAYEYTVTDPTVYTAPYTVMMPFRRTDGPLFEYALPRRQLRPPRHPRPGAPDGAPGPRAAPVGESINGSRPSAVRHGATVAWHSSARFARHR